MLNIYANVIHENYHLWSARFTLLHFISISNYFFLLSPTGFLCHWRSNRERYAIVVEIVYHFMPASNLFLLFGVVRFVMFLSGGLHYVVAFNNVDR